MSAFIILDKNFGPTWEKVVPYVDCKGDVIEESRHMLTAQKAVYAFICSVMNQGCFKVGLNTKIKALDQQYEVDGDVGGSPHIAEMNEAIKKALEGIKLDISKGDLNRKLVSSKITPLKDVANRFMTTPIGNCWLFLGKCCC